MASGTRSATTIAELDKKHDDKHAELNSRMDQLVAGMEEMRTLLREQVQPEGSVNNPQRTRGNGNGGNGATGLLATRISKVDFPKFDGRNVKEWLYRCDQFFRLDETPPENMVRLASIHMDGLALQWHLNYIRRKFDIYPPWSQYVTDIVARFGDVYEDPLSTLIQVKHTGKVQEYIDAFELAQTQVSLLPEHALSIFLSGLEHNTQMQVRMFNPTDIAHAANLAKLYESSKTPILRPTQKFTPSSHSFHNYSKSQPNFTKPPVPNQHPASNPKPNTTLAQTVTPNPRNTNYKPAGPFTSAQMAERKAKGLCMFCDEPFTPGHQLKHRRAQFFMLEAEGDSDEGEETEQSSEASADTIQPDSPILSLHALSGTPNHQTMRVTGMYIKRLLQILIDSGSTYNFLDLDAAKRLGCKLEPIKPMSVTVGGGNKIAAMYIVRGFTWHLQQCTFTCDVYVLPIVCCDLILGVQWLKSLGKIVWDFDQLQMEFYVQGRKCLLRSAKTPSNKLINSKKFTKSLNSEAEICFLYLDNETPTLSVPKLQLLSLEADSSELPLELQDLLVDFEDVFQEPTDLPPRRPGFDHKIPLKDDIIPFNLRPYRYSIVQKNVVDKLVTEMLDQGIIRHSNSPFASPAVLVRKKDGSWRLCVDYRRLNKHTVKDRYPIPLIEDLMDELGTATLFSKLDLRSGFNQLRIEEGDEFKTAFKTHGGHFEYLVMPFGLTNAPASFQALMNYVFTPFLRKFVIVFFDDILVYSPTIDAHVDHLRQVFETIRSHQLFLKKKKCHFATSRVEYLGHFISHGQVFTDPSKIQAVKDWSVPTNLKQLRGFLGLSGYYRRFVRDYGKIARPLTDLLKKDSFVWSEQATASFDQLKEALISSPVLALPDFSKPFVVETDASGKGIGAVLMQDHHPIAYISKSLGLRQQSMSVYERELLAIVYVV